MSIPMGQNQLVLVANNLVYIEPDSPYALTLSCVMLPATLL
jgi:hypothetical protein